MNSQYEQLWQETQLEILTRIGDRENFVRAVYSGRRRNHNPDSERIDIRPVYIKSEYYLQIVSTNGTQVETKNYLYEDFLHLALLDSGFANFLVDTRNERCEVRIGKKGQVFKKLSRVNLIPNFEHDHQKSRYLAEDDPFLIAVGISDSAGHLKPSMRNKYLQVEEFLKIVEKSVGDSFANKDVIRVVDLGCGHAYLSFAVLRFFELRQQKVSLFGVDVRSDTRVRNERLARELGQTENVHFVDSTIHNFPKKEVDIVLALHACDTATDDALAWAVAADVKIILAAPCCHKDLHRQIKEIPESLIQIFEHGILSVRQLDVLTDALRASILRLVGYKTEVFEFISDEHTNRNVMIRATRHARRIEVGNTKDEKLREYRHTCAIWGVKPALETRLKLVGFLPND